MSHLQIILPFIIPPTAMAPDLLRELHTPALAKLIALSTRGEIRHSEDFSRLLPHESLLSGHLSLESRIDSALPISSTEQNWQNSPATTHNKMQTFGLTASVGFWFTLSPIHIHIARDHLVLTDQRRLKLSDDEARALFEAAKTMCEEVGKTLLYGDAKTWFLRADDWHTLQTATMDAACGHNIDIWMPKGEQGLPWRKLQNEIQMLWFIHDVNEQRELRGDNLINSVWLHSGSATLAALPNIQNSNDTINLNSADKLANVDRVIKQANEQKSFFLNLDALLAPALNNDWPSWLDAMHKLETDWFAPLLSALSNKKIQNLSLIATDANKLTTFNLTSRSLWKFWTKPSVNKLFSLSVSDATNEPVDKS